MQPELNRQELQKTAKATYRKADRKQQEAGVICRKCEFARIRKTSRVGECELRPNGTRELSGECYSIGLKTGICDCWTGTHEPRPEV